jgi:4a-hydroxytetrahydrobiopterin dehydratase
MWQETENALARDFSFKNFREAFTFIIQVAFEAEAQNHHPEWSNTWNKVSIRLTTHEAGNQITDRDRKLAASIDRIYSRYV